MNFHLHTGAQLKIHEQGSTRRKINMAIEGGDKVAKLPANNLGVEMRRWPPS